MMHSQNTPADFCPFSGQKLRGTVNVNDQHWRADIHVWYFNPWTGTKRNPLDVDSDPHGILIRPAGEVLLAAGHDGPGGVVTPADTLTALGGIDARLVRSPEEVAQLRKDRDMVNHPPHYTAGKVECIDALEAATTGLTGIDAVCTAAAIKYLWRWKQKGGKQDLEKARWYINRLLEVQS